MNQNDTKSILVVYFKISILLLAFSFPASATCLLNDKSESNRINCLREAHFTFNLSDNNPAVSKKTNPQIIDNEVVFCRFHYQQQNGQSTKFRCALTTSDNILLDSKNNPIPEASTIITQNDEDYLADKEGQLLKTEKNKNIKAQIIKVRYYNGDKRNVENYTSYATTKILNRLNIPAHNYIMTKQVECFGCDVDPFSSNQQTVKMVENKYTQQIFKDASIEIKLNAKRIFSPDEKAWSWKDIINLQNEKTFSSEVQREIEELILANNFLGYVSESDDQNALVCLQSVENECQKVVAMVHDVGASLGNRNEYSGGSRPRGDIKSYNRATIFKSNGFQCVYNLSTFRGTLPPNDLSEEAKKSFLMRAERLTQTELFTIFENSHLMNLNSKGTPQAWAKSIRDKIDEIKIGCRNNYF